MARVRIPIVALGPDGRPIAGASITVRNRATGATTTVYAVEDPANLTTLAAGALVSDNYGRFPGWTGRGRLEATITPPPATGLDPYIESWEALPGGDDDAEAAWVDDDAATAGLLAVRQADGTIAWAKANAGAIGPDAIGNAELAPEAVSWTETGRGAAGLAAGAFAARRPNSNGALVTGVNASLGLTTEDYDLGGNYDGPNAEFVVPWDGVWHFGVYVCILAAPVSSRWRVYIFDDKSGGLGKLRDVAFIRTPSTGADDTRLYGSVDLSLPAGARVEPRIEAIDGATGASLYGASSTDASRFWGHCVGRT